MGEIESKPRDAEAEGLQSRQLQHWHEAIESLVQLQDAQNQELRGRPTAAAAERIEKFLAHDPIYRSVRDEFAGNSRQLKTEFRDTLERSLSVLERLANRNPDLDVPLDFKENHRFVYRLMALHLMLERSGDLQEISSVRSVLGMPVFIRPQLPSKSEPAPLPEMPLEQAATTPDAEESTLSKTPEEHRFFALLMSHWSGRLDSPGAQAELHGYLKKFEDGESFPAVRDTIRGEDIARGILVEQLETVAALVRDCREFGDGDLRTISYCVDLHNRALQLNRNHGLKEISDPLEALEIDEALSEKGRDYLIRAAAMVRDAHPITRKIIERLEERSIVSIEDVSKLNTAVTRFLLAGKAPDFIESRIKSALLGAMDKLDHVCNCAILASRRVHIDDLIILSRENLPIIARAANGDFDSVPHTNSRYGRNVRDRIDAEREILKSSTPQQRADFEAAASALSIPASVRKSDLRECLFTTMRQLPETGRIERLKLIGSDLIVLAAGGGDLYKLNQMLGQPPAEVRPETILSFIANMATLQREDVQGIPKVIEHAHELYSRRRAGNETQDMRGSIVEVETAMSLRKHGFKILGLGITLPSSNYDYDIIAESPTGERLGIEVKRGLGGLVGKNERMWKLSEHSNSQMVRFMVACERDKFVPMITVSDFHDVSWAGSALSDLLDQIQKEFGVKPRILNSYSAKELSF